MNIVAYRTGSDPGMPLVPASAVQHWSGAQFARASGSGPSQTTRPAGWFILNDRPFVARWDGGTGRSSLRIRATGEDGRLRATSFSGYGILTFHIPYLFRTPPGFNLLARGPANMTVDGISALEGLVETDWAVASFTMNWKFTRPEIEVTFDEGQPVCMLVPQRRGELEDFVARLRSRVA